MDKFVVTDEDLASIVEQPIPAPSLPTKLAPAVPLWGKLALAPLVFVLPVLCLLAIILRIALRSQPPRTRHAWDAYLCTTLVVSGILFTGVMAFVVSTGVGTVPISTGLASFDERFDFPRLPSSGTLTGRELSKNLKPLVVIASPAQKLWFRKEQLPSGSIGTAFLLQADAAGYLFATARHVVDGQGWASKVNGGTEVMLSTIEGGWSGANVIARHTMRDVALLWVPRHEGQGDFCQPVVSASGINSGDPVFVIGHPEGLNFSVSTGIISRVAENRTIQISAPISPGNSGGPVYDPRGALLGIVSYTFNKAIAPNAENLNFAVDADVLLDSTEWRFENHGDERLASYKKSCQSSQVDGATEVKDKLKDAAASK
jgi:S1-C subfamily serine protease